MRRWIAWLARVRARELREREVREIEIQTRERIEPGRPAAVITYEPDRYRLINPAVHVRLSATYCRNNYLSFGIVLFIDFVYFCNYVLRLKIVYFKNWLCVIYHCECAQTNINSINDHSLIINYLSNFVNYFYPPDYKFCCEIGNNDNLIVFVSCWVLYLLSSCFVLTCPILFYSILCSVKNLDNLNLEI